LILEEYSITIPSFYIDDLPPIKEEEHGSAVSRIGFIV
jgi:hypothetical protein